MMRLALLILILLSPLYAHEEILMIEQLIETTQKNLRSQEELLGTLLAYHDARDGYLADPESSKKATLLVKRAMRLSSHLERDHLSHLFSTDFLTELSFYNQVGRGHLAGR